MEYTDSETQGKEFLNCNSKLSKNKANEEEGSLPCKFPPTGCGSSHYLQSERAMADVSQEERIAAMLNLGKIGNESFNDGNWEKAVKAYNGVIVYGAYGTEGPENWMDRINCLELAAHLNLAACALKTKDFSEAKQKCKIVLARDVFQVKGWYRLGLAHFMEDELTECSEAIKKALELEPRDPVLLNLEERCRQKIGSQSQLLATALQPLFKNENLKQKTDNKLALATPCNQVEDAVTDSCRDGENALGIPWPSLSTVMRFLLTLLIATTSTLYGASPRAWLPVLSYAILGLIFLFNCLRFARRRRESRAKKVR